MLRQFWLLPLVHLVLLSGTLALIKILIVLMNFVFVWIVELTYPVCVASAVLSHFLLKERLPKMGVLGCVSCIVGSIVIVIHAPQEQTPSSVQEIWDLATQPGWILTCFNLPLKLIPIFRSIT